MVNGRGHGFVIGERYGRRLAAGGAEEVCTYLGVVINPDGRVDRPDGLALLGVASGGQIAGLDLALHRRLATDELVVLDRIEHAQRGEAVHVFVEPSANEVEFVTQWDLRHGVEIRDNRPTMDTA